MKNKHLNEDPKVVKRLRRIGKICLTIGGLLIVIAFIDMFASMNSFRSPSLFFLFFIASPVLFVGFVTLSYGYMGKVARYTATQVAPVTKDTTNYLIDGTKDEVVGLVRGIKGERKIICPYCQDENDGDAIYCDNCGKKIRKMCICGIANDGDSRFCKSCGQKL